MKFSSQKAQTAIEYLILLSLVAVIVMVSFSNLFPRASQEVSSLFSRGRASIMGTQVVSNDGGWCEWSKCVSCASSNIAACQNSPGGMIQYRLCDCPAPLGSGAVCSGSSVQSCGMNSP